MGAGSSSDAGDAPKEQVYDPRRIYYDHDGNLRYARSNRDRDAELLMLLALDDYDEADPHRVWFIVSNQWIRDWLKFSKYKLDEPPGPIDNSVLLHTNPDGTKRAKKTLKPPSADFPGHFRRVTREMWEKLVQLYPGSGPVIAVWGSPAHDMTRWRIFDTAEEANEDTLPAPEIPDETDKDGEKKDGEEKKKKKFGLF